MKKALIITGCIMGFLFLIAIPSVYVLTSSGSDLEEIADENLTAKSWDYEVRSNGLIATIEFSERNIDEFDEFEDNIKDLGDSVGCSPSVYDDIISLSENDNREEWECDGFILSASVTSYDDSFDVKISVEED